jgi:hypothetical protein
MSRITRSTETAIGHIIPQRTDLLYNTRMKPGWLAACGLLGALVSAPLAAQPPASIPTDRFVTVNGLRLRYLDWGSTSRPPLVLIHGIGRVAHTFDHIAPSFTADYHVLAIDMRGHGDSAWDPAANYPSSEDPQGFMKIARAFLAGAK